MPKFEEGQSVKSNVTWTDVVHGFVRRIGDRFGKNKKGDPVFETHSYIIVDDSGKFHYFLEGELHGND